MKNPTGLVIGSHFTRHNSVINDTAHSFTHLPLMTWQVENAASGKSAKPEVVLIHDTLKIRLMTTKTITAFVDHSSELNTTGTVKLLEKFEEATSLLVSRSISTVIGTKIAVGLTNIMESLYSIDEKTQITKFITQVDTAILSLIPEGGPNPTTYQLELLGTNQAEQHNNNFWFPTPENSSHTEDHTPIQTRLLKESHKLKEREKRNQKKSRNSK